jgi:hypothetical protein
MDKNQPLNPKPKVSITTSPIDQEWIEIVGTTKDANSSNSTKVKLVKVLNKFGVAHIVVNTSQTSIVGSIDCPTPSSISWDVKNSWELQGTAMQ